MKTLLLRPHHILDIMASFGAGEEFTPAASGNALHTVAKIILEDKNVKIGMHVGADEICIPCSMLVNGLCSNMLRQVDPPGTMQEYNDRLDERLLEYMGLASGQVMTAGEFYGIVAGKAPGIEKVCTHPGEDENERLEKLAKGLAKLGIRHTDT